MFLEGRDWPSFEAWLEHLKTLDPYEMRDQEVDYFLHKMEKIMGDEIDDFPTKETFLSDREVFMSLVKRQYEHKGAECDQDECEMDFDLLNDPPARKDLIISLLREIWDDYLAAQWEQDLPILKESIAAFESLDFSNKSTREIFLEVVNRDGFPEGWEDILAEKEEIIFIPSAHIGPYISMVHQSDTTARIVFGARIPEGASVQSPALQRSELLMRLDALSDETRLRMLELLTMNGELSSKEIMDHLDLTQSTASRHLRQLSVTGYLVERRLDGAKYYQMNKNRIENTLEAIEKFLS
jgi:DNA-binding transcriptional ArsR family regulator